MRYRGGSVLSLRKLFGQRRIAPRRYSAALSVEFELIYANYKSVVIALGGGAIS